MKVVSVMEAHSVTGPAKNLLEFAKRGRQGSEGLPAVQLTIAAYRRGGEAESPFIMTARSAGIPVEIIPERGRFDWEVPRRLREAIQRLDPDIVQTHNIKSHFFLRLSGIGRSRKWLAFHHGFTNEDWRMRLYNMTSRWSFRGAYRAVTVCRPFVDQLVERGVERERILVRPNSVRAFAQLPEPVVAAVREEFGLQGGTKLVVAVGRLSQEKGHADLLESFALIRARRPDQDLRLVIVGEGGERSNLIRLTKSLGLEGQVRLAGIRDDVSPYYVLADVFVLPSHSEGSPNVLLEAMAAGCPVVATEVGGVPDTVQHEETALLVPPSAPARMAAAIERLLRDRELSRKLGDRAKKVAETEYSPEQYSRAMIQMYREILGQPA